MKVLQVNCVYKKGSTGKIVYDIHSELQKLGIESVVCYGRGKKIHEANVYKVSNELYSKFNNLLSRFTGIMYGGCFFSTNRLIGIIKKEKPNIVHLHCINGYFVNIYRLITWLKNNHIKTVLILHAEFMYTGGCGHSIDCNQWSTREGCGHSECPRWRSETKLLFKDGTQDMWAKMKKAFDGFDRELVVTSVSPWLMNRAQESTILKGKKHITILNGLDTKIFHPYDNGAKLKKKLGIENEKVIFHATPTLSLDPEHIKGGYYVVELAKMLENDNVKIVVAGSYPQDVDLPSNMIMLGRINDQKLLAQYYSMADVTVITSKRETFSMIAAESMSCGTPVVGFRAGGPETISISNYSAFVEYGCIQDLKKTVMSFLVETKNKDISNTASKAYSKETMTKDYLLIYNQLLDGEVYD